MKLSAPIFLLKKQAKELKRSQSIPLSEALNLVAKKEGYNSWSLLLSKSNDALPNSYSEIVDFFNPGDLVLIGGRPSMGKTSFAIGLFIQTIKEVQTKHFLFTLDLSPSEICKRMIAYDKLINQNYKNFLVDYSDDINADYIIKKIKDEISSGSLIVIDYLQLLDHKRSNPSLQEQIEKLKIFAKENNCTIVFLSQIHRSIESRVNKRPTLNDVKLINPLDLNLFNKALLLYKDAKYPHQVEAIFCKPQNHLIAVTWDNSLYRFSN